MAARETFDSWKEISSFLRRDVRTCQRWEKELDLPVHRLDGSPKARVFAYADELESWLEAKAGENETSAEGTARAKLTRRAAVPGAILVLAAGGFLLWRFYIRPAGPPVASGKPTLALLAFKNGSGDPSLDIWKENLPTLLAAGLRQSRYLRLLDDPTVHGILRKLKFPEAERRTSEELRTIAQEGRATHLVSGSYLETGGRFVINLALVDGGTGRVLAEIQENASGREAIFDTVEALVRGVKSALNVPERPIDVRDYRLVGDAYTRNPQALRYYIDAARADQDIDYDQVIRSCQKALELDPDFAMVYVMLSKTFVNRNDYFEARRYLAKAFELRAKLPDLDRRIVEADLYLLREETAPKAVAILKKAVEDYPDDFMARWMLAFAYLSTDPELAIGEYRALTQGPGQARYKKAYLQLAHWYCATGDPGRAREAWEEFVQEGTPDASDLVWLANLLMLEKRPDAALRELEEAATADPGDIFVKRAMARFLAFRDEWSKSRQLLDGLRTTSPDPTELDGDYMILGLLEGRFREVLALVDTQEARLGPVESLPLGENVPLILWGRIYLQAGQPQKALEEFRKALAIVRREEGRVKDEGFENLLDRRRTCLIGCACALCDAGRIAEAEAVAAEHEGLVPRYIKKSRLKCSCCMSEFIRGAIALANKRYPEAVRNLESGWRAHRGEDFINGSEHAYFLDLLGDAYRLDGRLQKAAETYARIGELVTGRLAWGAVYSRSFYKLGLVYEQMGKKDEARREYGKFLGLWKDADPGLPEVPDARARLARL